MSIKDIWNTSSKKDRAKLSKALGYKSEWVDIDFDDLPKRSGGMLQRDLNKLWEERQKRKK